MKRFKNPARCPYKYRKPACPKCSGLGWTLTKRTANNGVDYAVLPCPKCNPTGRRPKPEGMP